MKKRLLPLILALVMAVGMLPTTAFAAEMGLSTSLPDFTVQASEVDQMIADAKAQFASGSHTPLSEPVSYRILWIGYTHVTYGELDFRMTDFDKDYLRAVTLNFEKVVETYAKGNVDITIDLYFEDTAMPLTKDSSEDWLYLAKETVQADIDKYDVNDKYDTVLTTVQTEGSENEQRNRNKAGYDVHYVMLGLETHGVEDEMGYSTFDLYLPKEGTYPLKDPTVPSLYATSVAVHEWLHQLEYLGNLLDIEYPSTHVYQGPENFPGYQKIIADQDNYDYFVLYEQVLSGTVPYTGNGGVTYVGMYPKMWPLIQRKTLNIGLYTIQSPDGNYLTGQAEEPYLTKTSQKSQWFLHYGGNGCYILIPEDIPTKRIDLSNAWDSEGNIVNLFTSNPNYADAQRWRLTKNSDGSYCIRTAYESGRAVTVDRIGGQAVIQTANTPSEQQKWIFIGEGSTAPSISTPTTPVNFTDVPAGQWYADPVAWAKQKGIAAGTSDTTFSPTNNCTQAQILTFLYRAAQGTGKTSADDMLKAASWAKEKGMIDDSFEGSKPCTRATAVNYIWQAFGRPSAETSSFTDVDANADYAGAVSWAVAKGITSGTGNGKFSPDDICTRGHIATFLYRAYN